MLKRIVNSASIDMTVAPIDPMLIKSGQATVGGVDMAFVRTYRINGKPEPFIPGSSLKGVMRSYSEKICRSLRPSPVPVCLPYAKPEDLKKGEEGQASCGLRIEALKKKKAVPSSDAYRILCPACRTFGAHVFIGRASTSDAYLTETSRKQGALFETRDGVAIDRLTGGPAGSAKYDLEVLTRAEFCTRIELVNFERWQLGLVGLVLRDMEDELIRIGMGKSRGLGRIRAKLTKFTVSYFGKPSATLVGLHSACDEKEREAYGLAPELNPGAALDRPRQEGLRFVHDLGEHWKTALEPAVKDLTDYIGKVPWPESIDSYTAGGGR